MLFNRLSKKDEIFPDTNDILIIYSEDQRKCEIHRINEYRDKAIVCTGKVIVPIADTVISNSEEGLIYLYNAPFELVEETKRLAQLEKSIVLSQITEYTAPTETNSFDYVKVALLVLVGLSMVLGMTSCGAGA